MEALTKDVSFCPTEPFFKSITGAAEKGIPVRFRIVIGKNAGAEEAFFRLFDYDGRKKVFPMKREENSDYPDSDVFATEIIPEECGTHYYDFVFSGNRVIYAGRSGKGAILSDEPARWILNVTERRYSVPFWAEGGIMYHIFVDRFCSVGDIPEREGAVIRRDWGNMPEYRPDPASGKILNNDFFGGNLKGIVSKLDYLRELGVSIIYLSPIFKAYSNHKYDVGDYSEIDPSFGTEDDFTELCERAGDKGMRVILDGVFNHTGSDSRYFDKLGRYGNGAYGHTDSPYRDWYLFDRSGEKYECWWNFDTLPKLNPDSGSLREYLCGDDGIVAYWLGKGASGWRLDVVDELRDDILTDIVKAAKTRKNDALIIGEVWEDASVKVAYGEKRRYFDGDELDSVMNYPLRNAIIDFVRNRNENALSEVNFEIINNYPKSVMNCLMNVLGTHDTERILTALGGETANLRTREEKMRYRMTFEQLTEAKKLLKLAAVLLYTHYGFPSVYYGDEAGVQGCGDPFNRTCFPWNSTDGELHSFFVKLGRIRRENPVFADGEFIEYETEKGFYSYLRENGKERILVAVNRSGAEKELKVGRASELLGGKEVCGAVTVADSEAVILRLDGSRA